LEGEEGEEVETGEKREGQRNIDLLSHIFRRYSIGQKKRLLYRGEAGVEFASSNWPLLRGSPD